MTLHDITLQMNYKYITLHYTMNFNGKVTIQKKERKIRSKSGTAQQVFEWGG